ncbi:hypothetical protein GCK72_025890 [Caenorhabditis remanei]|uniref:Protein kinase domain-containing protein n=1 Tax=Caenorhabditis remanei TaxID=31234 RepID=A0A6A5G401_CAERE|nr:hypothetical protein GCK72_025890 [Caenorhabditis remanei]KAF1749422.1 hypothetical protein GCK72_025890 [Caenorhabditis remanei]
MTNFPKDCEQKTRVRNMESSLIFFLGVEVMFAALEFFFMSPVVLHNYKIIKIFFIIWIPNLVIASFFFLAVKPGIFAMYRAGFRMIHFTAIANIYYWYRLMPVSVCTIGLYVAEFICLVDGVSNEKPPHSSTRSQLGFSFFSRLKFSSSHSDSHFLTMDIVFAPGALANGRFRVLDMLHSRESQLYNVKDTQQGDVECILKLYKRDIFDDAYYNEITFLKACKGKRGFPYLFSEFPFTHGDIECDCIVISDVGDTLLSQLKMRSWRFTMANTVRIGYRCLELLEKMHAMGYVHMDVHQQNIMVEHDYDGELKLNLIDFEFTSKIHPPPSCYNFLAWHSSLNVATHGDYTPIDDLVSMVLILFSTQRIDPFGRNKEEFIQKKEEFHADPMRPFPNAESQWLGRLYIEIERQRTDGYDKSKILEILNAAVPGIDPRSPIDFGYQRGTYWIQ